MNNQETSNSNLSTIVSSTEYGKIIIKNGYIITNFSISIILIQHMQLFLDHANVIDANRIHEDIQY